MKSMKLAIGLSFAAMTIGLTGCGQGFKAQSSLSGSSNKSESVNIDAQLQKAEEASVQAQQAMSEADQALAQITDSQGNINLGLFTKSSTSDVKSQFVLNGLMTKLTQVFDQVFSRVEAVKAKFELARQSLMDALLKLDGTNPAQAAMVAEIRAKLASIDMMESQFRNGIHLLAGKLDLAMTGLDRLVSGATSFVPGWGWVVGLALDYFVMNDVKTLVTELKARLLAL